MNQFGNYWVSAFIGTPKGSPLARHTKETVKSTQGKHSKIVRKMLLNSLTMWIIWSLMLILYFASEIHVIHYWRNSIINLYWVLQSILKSYLSHCEIYYDRIINAGITKMPYQSNSKLSRIATISPTKIESPCIFCVPQWDANQSHARITVISMATAFDAFIYQIHLSHSRYSRGRLDL